MSMRKGIRMLMAFLCLLITILPVQALNSDPSITEDLYSDSVLIIDADTGQILSEKNADEIIYPASMTKIMTAIVAIESLKDLDERVLITDEMLAGLYEMNASVAGFMSGDQPTVRDLLYAAALPSGADACHALAIRTAGSLTAFVDLMNQKAAALDMAHTSFMNTSGLDDENHYTTVRDLAALMQYCIQNDTFCEIFSAASYVSSPLASYPGGLPMSSTIWSTVDQYNYYVPGLIGGKTGFTYIAGHCLAYWAELNGMHIIGVSAHADTGMYDPSHIDDASTVLMRLSNWQRNVLLQEGEVIHTVTVHHKNSDETIDITADHALVLDIPSDGSIETECTIADEVNAGLYEGDLYGAYRITQNGNTLYEQTVKLRVPREKSGMARFLLWLKSMF